MIQLTPKHKRILKWAGYPLLALVTFVFAVSYTFPYHRLEGKIAEFLADKYDVEIESIEPTLIPGGVVLTGVSMTTRPKKKDDKPVTVYIDEIELDFGLMAAITGDLDLDVAAQIGDGTISGEITFNKAGLEAEFETEELPLDGIPGVASAVGLPMAGGLNAYISLKLPKMKWRDAEGSIELECSGCTVGDGKSKLKMKQQANKKRNKRFRKRRAVFAAEGLTVPKLNLGTATAEVKIKKGVGTIKNLSAKSKDGDLKIEGRIEFKDPFKMSKFPGCMRFKLSDDLKKREPDFGNIELMLPARARQDDGQFAIPTKGTLTQLGWDPKRRCRGTKTGGEEGSRARPTISRRDPDEDKPGVANTRGGDSTNAGNGETKEEKLKRAGNQANNDEAETKSPGNSGPKLGAGALRDLKRKAAKGDDVKAGEDGEGEEGEEGEDEEGEAEEEEGEEEGDEEKPGRPSNNPDEYE